MLRVTAIISVILMLCGCAQIMPLDGGPKDITPPQLDSATTLPLSGTTSFRGQKIQIGFKEYIKLNNASENIIITPFPDTMPEFRVKNKEFYVEFINPLQENTTYSIFIDGAITDITENNDSLYHFVFSTGPYIDSLKVKGKVKKAFTNQPAEEVLVGLYPDKDSAIFKNKPIYFARTDENGNYEMSYIKPGKYQLFTLDDQNKTFTADQLEENIGFLNEPLEVQKDTSFDLILFQREDNRQYITKKEYQHPGLLTLVLNLEEALTKIESDNIEGFFKEPTERIDSTLIWLPKDTLNVVNLVVQTDSFSDTVSVDRYQKKKEGSAKEKMLKIKPKSEGILHPNDTITITSEHPIDQAFEDSIKVFRDSFELEYDVLLKENSRELHLLLPTQKDSVYRVIIHKGGLKDMFGLVNDSTAMSFEQKGNDYYGSLKIIFDSLLVEHGFVELLSKGKVIGKKNVKEDILFKQLSPGSYEVRLISDDNQNNRWDTGNFSEKRQPEKVFYHDQTVDIKSNWDMEINWKIKVIKDVETKDKNPRGGRIPGKNK